MTFPHFRKVLDEREDPVDDRGHVLALREAIMNGLTRQQADDLRRTAEYLTHQMRLTPHPTERSRIRAMADTADYVAERIDALLAAAPVESNPRRTPIGELLRMLPLGNYK